ncbi:phenylacetate--CoA ligase family protein [Planomicrobium okeanokoites]|uniref:Phenylacetate--CoA ligase family protein n=1 Tax=Planomicrobium okeanokoites TaxID=244 RepID=A0ABV7KN87_PLAOK|nr:phenylacetate--CoA ligase family protein [Planomicrobium okeanokoites]TAA66085.1 phenylacetate--CoA ligase family protein [Planomicrobium okeanokoites]
MNKLKFITAYYIKRPKVIKAYKEIKKLESLDRNGQKEYQNIKLKELISYVVKEIPYYSNLFRELNLKVSDIQTTKDLIKLPILTKEIIKKNPELFIPKNYNEKIVKGSTGGSTGVPLKFLMSETDYSKGVALLLRGFEFGNYQLGDSMSIIAGSSLTSNTQSLKSKIQDWLMNFNHFSSYGMNEKDFEAFFRDINKKKPKFLRGYASSLFLFASYLRDNNMQLEFQIQAIFSTSEKLMPNQRNIIESVFKAKVFDNYGLNDGGITAFECNYHNGMHIDFERAILEVTNDDGTDQIIGEEGKILATNLFNYAMPLIRYDTGDLGEIYIEDCKCGCKRPLLKGIAGRTTDYLKINETYIGSPVLTVLMGKIDIESYQIIQTGKDSVKINVVKGEKYDMSQELFISNSLKEHVNEIKIDFNYLDDSKGFSENNKKHKFIINDDFK